MIRFYFIIIICLFFASPVLHAEQAIESKTKKHTTVFFDMQAVNTSASVQYFINNKIRSGLRSLPYCDLLSDNDQMKHKVQKPGKGYTNYASYKKEYAVPQTVHRIAGGNIQRIQKKAYHEKDTKGKNQYILKKFKEDYYIITLEIADTGKDKRIALIEQKSDPDKQSLNSAINTMINTAAKYFGPRAEASSRQMLEISLSLAGAFMATEGPFQDFSKLGYGCATAVTLTNIFVKGLSLQMYFGYYYIDEEKKQLNALNSIFHLLLVGYTFTLHEHVRLTPYGGFGYHVHLADETDGDTRTFVDSYLSVQCELSFPFQKNYAFFITPSYNFFFEEKNMGRYFSTYAGFRYLWYR